MTYMPADAPRSEDGQWWWDGTQWQPVAGHAAEPAQQAQGTTATVPSETVGQLSEDGQWRWDGAQWQPAQAAAAGASGAATPAPAGRQVTLGVPTTQVASAHDGTTAVIVHYDITNSGTTPIEPRSLHIGFYVVAAGATAESAAYHSGDVLAALAPGEQHQGQWPIQVDPGEWRVWVAVSDDAGGASLATSEDVAFEVSGHRAVAHDFDDTQTYAVTVTITNVEHIAGALYRVHYDVQSDRDVPIGLKVSGSIDAASSQSGQVYDLTTTIAAGRPHPHYLTLEADVPSHSTAKIYVDPGGPSEKSDTVTVEIADDGTPTMSR